MNTRVDTISQLLDAIEILVDARLANAHFDRTRTARVLSAQSDGTYTIMLDGNQLSGIVCLKGSTYAANDIVKVVIPESQSSNMFILGKI